MDALRCGLCFLAAGPMVLPVMMPPLLLLPLLPVGREMRRLWPAGVEDVYGGGEPAGEDMGFSVGVFGKGSE